MKKSSGEKIFWFSLLTNDWLLLHWTQTHSTHKKISFWVCRIRWPFLFIFSLSLFSCCFKNFHNFHHLLHFWSLSPSIFHHRSLRIVIVCVIITLFFFKLILSATESAIDKHNFLTMEKNNQNWTKTFFLQLFFLVNHIKSNVINFFLKKNMKFEGMKTKSI